MEENDGIVCFCRVCGKKMVVESRGGNLDAAALKNMLSCSDACREREREQLISAPKSIVFQGI
ncbi:MAG: hypothetical protein WC715_04430 [Patescibacteria group bacterium]|jgi:hypothetical protein